MSKITDATCKFVGFQMSGTVKAEKKLKIIDYFHFLCTVLTFAVDHKMKLYFL